MILKWMCVILVALLAGIWDASLVTMLPGWFQLTWVLPIAMFFFFTERKPYAFTVLAIGAILLDSYTWYGSGSTVVRWLLLAFLWEWLSIRFFTNRSYYVMVFSLLAFQVLDWIVGFLFSELRSGVQQNMLFTLPDHWVGILVWHFVIMSVAFGIMSVSKGRWIHYRSKTYGAF